MKAGSSYPKQVGVEGRVLGSGGNAIEERVADAVIASITFTPIVDILQSSIVWLFYLRLNITVNKRIDIIYICIAIAYSNAIIAINNGVGNKQIGIGSRCQRNGSSHVIVVFYKLACVIDYGVVVESSHAEAHAACRAIAEVIGEEGVEACSLVHEHTSGEDLVLTIAGCVAHGGRVVEHEASLYRRVGAVAEDTAAFHSPTVGHIVDDDAVFQSCSLVHVHAGSTSMRHNFVAEETVTDGEAIPFHVAVFYIVRIFFLCSGG